VSKQLDAVGMDALANTLVSDEDVLITLILTEKYDILKMIASIKILDANLLSKARTDKMIRFLLKYVDLNEFKGLMSLLLFSTIKEYLNSDILAKKVNPNMKIGNKGMPFYRCVGVLECDNYSQDVDIDARDLDGKTKLHTRFDLDEIFLNKYKPNPFIRDNDGKYAIEYKNDDERAILGKYSSEYIKNLLEERARLNQITEELNDKNLIITEQGSLIKKYKEKLDTITSALEEDKTSLISEHSVGNAPDCPERTNNI